MFLLCVRQVPSALAGKNKSEQTEAAPVDPNQQAEIEKGKNESRGANPGQTQTWGGGPKCGALHPDWLKWMEDLRTKPPGTTPFPKSQPAPKYPKQCERVVREHLEYSDDPSQPNFMSNGSARASQEGVQVYCSP